MAKPPPLGHKKNPWLWGRRKARQHTWKNTSSLSLFLLFPIVTKTLPEWCYERALCSKMQDIEENVLLLAVAHLIVGWTCHREWNRVEIMASPRLVVVGKLGHNAPNNDGQLDAEVAVHLAPGPSPPKTPPPPPPPPPSPPMTPGSCEPWATDTWVDVCMHC